MVMEMIKCKKCWGSFTRSWFYHLADTYTLQPCKNCRKVYSSKQYAEKKKLKNNKK